MRLTPLHLHTVLVQETCQWQWADYYLPQYELTLKNYKIYFAYALGLMILSSCEKEEKLWELPKPGSEKIVSISMGETYENTSYFQLSTGNTTQRYLQIWDIAFSTDKILSFSLY